MSLPIARVTVTEDRALVVREGTVKLAAGTQRVRVEDVAPVLVDKSVRASVVSGAAKVGEARVLRELRATLPEDPAARTDVQKLDAEIDVAFAELESVAAALARARSELGLLDAAARATLDDVSWNAAHGSAPAEAGLRGLEAREKELGAEIVRLSFENRERRETYDRLRARRAAADHPATRARTTIELVVSADAAGEARLAIEYLVPGACWRPQHTATLLEKKVSIATDACVWQNTGEAWDDVELRLSTERPSLGREPPTMSDDTLAVQRKQEVLRVEARDERIETAGLGGAARTERVPGIDDGGEPRVLVARDRARVPTDGRPHRVPIGAFETDAKSESICVAQLAAAVVLRTEQTNAGKGALLAGPVDLVRRGGFVGRTKISFVAPGETFELGWGPDPGVRVRRETEEVEEEPGMLSGWLVRTVRERVRVSGLDASRRTFTLTLRIPVSEIEKVQIAQDLSETTGKTKADADGFVRWSIDLPPSGRREIELRYAVKRHKDVVGI
jgi:hypothetical protein